MSDYYEMFLNVNCIFLTLYLVLCQIWGKKVTKTFLVETEGSARKIASKKVFTGNKPTSGKEHNGYNLAVLNNTIGQYVWTTLMPTDRSLNSLPVSERVALKELIQAAKYMDTIWNRQVWKDYERSRKKIAKLGKPIANLQLELFDIMRGPWDRQNKNTPFAVKKARPDGAGFYPETFTEADFDTFVKGSKTEKWMKDKATMVWTDQYGKLITWPYSKFFRKELEPAVGHLLAAANYTHNESLKRFLKSRAVAFTGSEGELDDYLQSDKDWMDLDSSIEITIGPDEVYEDTLIGVKGSFAAFVTISDPEESSKLLKYKSLLPEMEQNLPYKDSMKTKRGSESPIHVVDLVFASGESRQHAQTLAFNLPNDERVKKEKGSKKVLLQNVINAKFDQIIIPIADALLDPSQTKFLSKEAFYNNILFHELSHGLGPAFVENSKAKGVISKALGSSYSALEEGKADAMGIYNTLFMVKKKILPKKMRYQSLVTYISSLFRTMRFGAESAHGKAAVLQFNHYMKEKAVLYNTTYHVDVQQLENSITSLVRDLCYLEHNADKYAIEKFYNEFGHLDEETKLNLDALNEVPVDIRPCFPLAGEQCK